MPQKRQKYFSGKRMRRGEGVQSLGSHKTHNSFFVITRGELEACNAKIGFKHLPSNNCQWDLKRWVFNPKVSSALETFSIAKELSCVGGGLVDLWEVDLEERLACSSYTRTRIFHHARREGCQSCKDRTKAGGMYSSAFVKRNPALGLAWLCTKEGLYSVPGGWGSDSYAGFGWGGKAKAALQSVLHMRAGLCSLHIARPPTYCPHIARPPTYFPHIAQPNTYFSACRRFSNYFLRNIHRSRASGWLRLRYLSLFWLDGEPAELNLFYSTC